MDAGLYGDPAYAGTQGAGGNVYPYTNTQLPATIWYHDHALGITGSTSTWAWPART